MKQIIIVAIFLFSIVGIGQNFYTEFHYKDSINKGISIKNSYPKGGQKYTDHNGNTYTYVVFWTCITNKTDANLDINISFPKEAFTTPSSADINFNIFLPKEEMTFNKAALTNYGLDVISFLDNAINKPSNLEKTIKPNQSYLFYSVAITNKGVNGVVRAGFDLKAKNLIYKINDHNLLCGKIVTKN